VFGSVDEPGSPSATKIENTVTIFNLK
jgi:hypothetical protein